MGHHKKHHSHEHKKDKHKHHKKDKKKHHNKDKRSHEKRVYKVEAVVPCSQCAANLR